MWFGHLLSKCTKHEKDCANFCVLLRKSKLYQKHPCEHKPWMRKVDGQWFRPFVWRGDQIENIFWDFVAFLKKSTVETRKMYKTLGCCRSQFIHSLHVLGKFVSSQSFVQREEKRRQSRRKIGPFLDCLWGENILIHKKSSLDSAAKWSGKTMLICQVLKMSEGIQRNSIKADFTFLVEKLDFP